VSTSCTSCAGCEPVTDRLGALHIRREIEQHVARLHGLDHVERTDLLDRVTVLRNASWRLNHALYLARGP
jgi:hypothetical protein